MNNDILEAFDKLKTYCIKEGFKGYDPYDGLNSKLFNSMPVFSKNRLARLAWIQFFKRFPFNLRPLAGIEKDYNPKALGLFLSGYCRIFRNDPDPENEKLVRFFADKLIELRAEGWSGACWGYNFDWQARAFFQPRNTPTVVATSFISHALFDAYEIFKEDRWLQTAISSADFILKDLNRTMGESDEFTFSYSPLDHSVVYNAGLLGAGLLARISSYTGDKNLAGISRNVVAFNTRKQQKNGAWAYGDLSYHQWIDNFHTGFNLESIAKYRTYTGDQSFNAALETGLDYYLNTFFTPEGISRYYSHKTYPVDIHAPAQLVATIDALDQWERAGGIIESVLGFTIKNMQHRDGYFSYQLNRFIKSEVPYMRWAQAWMFYAFSIYINHEKEVCE